MMKPAGFLILMSLCTISNCEVSLDVLNQYDYLDFHAVTTCLGRLDGSIQLLDPNNKEKGSICDYKTKVWTGDRKQAWEFCKSNTPFHIVEAEPVDNGGTRMTRCKFQMNLQCGPDYYQIHNRCYKLLPGRFTYNESQAACKKLQPALDSKLADYYSELLSIHFEQLAIGAAWVDVPHMGDYYDVTDKDPTTGIYVQYDAWKFHVKIGTILMMPDTDTYAALCQYQPGTNQAEMFYMAGVYSPVYPFIVTSEEVIIPSPGYTTIDTVYSNKYTTTSMSKTCNGMSQILGMDSYPSGDISEISNDIKPALNSHRFYLTAAYKNSGCSLKDYLFKDHSTNKEGPAFVPSSITNNNNDFCDAASYSFSKMGEFATKAAMRAPILCTFNTYVTEYNDCEAPWHGYKRSTQIKACHIVKHGIGDLIHYNDAIQRCKDMDAVLAGFENLAELEFIKPLTEFKGDGNGYNFNHYWLGGKIPCPTGGDCEGPDKKRYVATWNENVSRNNLFLNTHTHEGYGWTAESNEVISLRDDHMSFHSHHPKLWGRMYYICTKFPQFVKKKVSKGSRRNGR